VQRPPPGKTPAIALINPKFPHNVGAAVRACSCFGIEQLWLTGERMLHRVEGMSRLPREERIKGYKDVAVIHDDRFFDRYQGDVTPVAVELLENSEMLTYFEHPENALYVFGPEDGSIEPVWRRHCHRFIVIPTAHCLNLAAAINIVLYDRRLKRQLAGLEPVLSINEMLHETRGFISDPMDHVALEAIPG
jgi:tRNA(Leu) C34 or U34 (ribose-2'-O)-methylase TrmL